MKAVHIRKSNKTKTDKDWTNSKSFGFVGANSNSKRHLRGKDEFIRLANKEGFATGEAITRKDILMLLEKYPELNNPTWFTSYRNKDGVNPYKLERGKGFILPSVDAVDEVELIYLLIDLLTS